MTDIFQKATDISEKVTDISEIVTDKFLKLIDITEKLTDKFKKPTDTKGAEKIRKLADNLNHMSKKKHKKRPESTGLSLT